MNSSTVAIKREVTLSVDTITFQLGENSPGYSTSFQYLDWAKPTLSMYNKVLNTIDLYSAESRSMYERIQLKKEGPDGVGTSNLGVWFLSQDSIMVAHKMTLSLINRKAEVIKRFRLEIPELGGYPDFQVSTNKPVIRVGNQLIAAVYPQKDVFDKDDLKSWKNFVLIDLESGNMEPFGDLPAVMKDRLLGFNYVDKSMIKNGDDMIISFYASKDLYKINTGQLENMQKIALDNTNFKDIEEMKDKSPEFMNYTRHYLINDSYDALFWNGKYYMRINQYGISDEELKRRDWAKWKVLQFYDKNFNLVHEWELESKYGDYTMTAALAESFILRIGTEVEDEMNFLRISLN